MSVGAGIAIAGIWIATAAIAKDANVSGIGMAMTLGCALLATAWVAWGAK